MTRGTPASTLVVAGRPGHACGSSSCRPAAEGHRSSALGLSSRARLRRAARFLIVRVDQIDAIAEMPSAINAFQRAAGGCASVCPVQPLDPRGLAVDAFESRSRRVVARRSRRTTPLVGCDRLGRASRRFGSSSTSYATPAQSCDSAVVLEAMLVLARDLGLCTLGSLRCAWRRPAIEATMRVRLHASASFQRPAPRAVVRRAVSTRHSTRCIARTKSAAQPDREPASCPATAPTLSSR